jgi:hypothetical protein
MRSDLLPASGKPSAQQAVIDVIGRNPGVELECHTRGFIDPERDNG